MKKLITKRKPFDKDMRLFLSQATSAALKAGEGLMKGFGRTQRVSLKGEIDLVTDADKASQELIVKKLDKAFPDHTIIAEEAFHEDRHSPFTWFIDPLDGTTNYTHGFPAFCVSIALQFKKHIILGVIHNPLLKETFVAMKGNGTSLNGRRVFVSKTSLLSNSLLATGFPYDLRRRPGEPLKDFCNMAVRARAIRRAGSAALDLAYVSCGRFDGFWEMRLKPWDLAAGVLMVKEAGGVLTDYSGHEFELKKGRAVASNGRIHKEILGVLRMKSVTLTPSP